MLWVGTPNQLFRLSQDYNSPSVFQHTWNITLLVCAAFILNRPPAAKASLLPLSHMFGTCLDEIELCFTMSHSCSIMPLFWKLLYKALCRVSGVVLVLCWQLDANWSQWKRIWFVTTTRRCQRGGVTRPVFKDTGRTGAVNPLTPAAPRASSEQRPAGTASPPYRHGADPGERPPQRVYYNLTAAATTLTSANSS